MEGPLLLQELNEAGDLPMQLHNHPVCKVKQWNREKCQQKFKSDPSARIGIKGRNWHSVAQRAQLPLPNCKKKKNATKKQWQNNGNIKT